MAKVVKNALLVFLSMLFVIGILAACEFVFRIIKHHDIATSQLTFIGNDPEGLQIRSASGSMINTPNFKGKSFGQDVYINDEGYRGPIIKSKPICLLIGDSVSFGPGVPYERLFSSRISDFTKKCTVLNSGVMGWGIREYLDFVEHRIDKIKPEHVFMQYGINDILYTGPEESFRESKNTEYEKLGDRVYFFLKVHFQETHNYLRTRSYLYVWIMGLSKAKWRMHFRVYEKAWRDERMVSSYFQKVLRIKAILQERNIGLTFIIIAFAGQILEPPEPHDYPFVDIDQLVPFLEKHSIPYISFVEPFMGQHNAYIHGDPYHLSQHGHELVAQKIFQAIQHANSE